MTTGVLVSALRNLAASAEKQAAYLDELGVAPSCDELALDLEDALGKGLPPEVEAAVNQVNAQLDEMSGEENAALWHVDALKSAEEWEIVRRLAAEALDACAQTSGGDE
jgi:predicted Mrr-cat superfamily restriction endonuclease